jgi:hypothetical protein
VASVALAIKPTNVNNSKDATATIATHRIHGFWFVRGAGAINIRAGGDGGISRPRCHITVNIRDSYDWH